MKNRNKYNQTVIEQLILKHGFSRRFIHQCLSGERHSVTSETICKDYKTLIAKVEKAINQAINS